MGVAQRRATLSGNECEWNVCEDIDTTVGELRTKGAQFRGPIEQREYGRVIMMMVPGNFLKYFYHESGRIGAERDGRESTYELK